MNYAEICIIKRDGKREDFSISKIKNAIGKAFHATGINKIGLQRCLTQCAQKSSPANQ